MQAGHAVVFDILLICQPCVPNLLCHAYVDLHANSFCYSLFKSHPTINGAIMAQKASCQNTNSLLVFLFLIVGSKVGRKKISEAKNGQSVAKFNFLSSAAFRVKNDQFQTYESFLDPTP
jgi:hypothetical protein